MPYERMSRNIEAALATKAHLDLHFKNATLRECDFHKKKLILKDKELHIARKDRRLNEPSDDESPVIARSTSASGRSLRQSRSCPGSLGVSGACTVGPGLGASQRDASRRGVEMTGASRNRFAAGHPVYMHPAVHPGSLAHRPEISPPRRSGSGRGARPNFGGTLPEQSAALTTQVEPFLTEVLSPSRSNTFTASHMLSAPRVGDLDAYSDDPFLSFGLSEEEQLFAADEEFARTQGLLPRPADPPGTIDRLGDMMALLGPRYKTLPPGMIWEKAVEGGTTPLERMNKRLGAAAPKKKAIQIKRPAPEEMPDLDHEVAPRAAWLTLRAQERARHKDA